MTMISRRKRVLLFSKKKVSDKTAYGVLLTVIKPQLNKMDIAYLLSDTDPARSINNIGSESGYNLISHGTQTHKPGHGWMGDGTTGYFSTGYAPSSNGVLLQSGSISIGGLSDVKPSSSAMPYISSFDSTNTGLEVRNTGIILNTQKSFTAQDYINFGVGSADSTLSWRNYVDGDYKDLQGMGDNIATSEVVINAKNTNGVISNYSDGRTSFVFAGGNLTDSDVKNLYDSLEEYHDAVRNYDGTFVDVYSDNASDAASTVGETDSLSSLWQANSTLMESTNEEAVNGVYSVKLTSTAITGTKLVRIPVEVGGDYNLKIYTKNGIGINKRLRVDLQASSLSYNFSSPNWKSQSFRLTSTRTEAVLWIYPSYTGGAIDDTLYVDKIILEKLN